MTIAETRVSSGKLLRKPCVASSVHGGEQNSAWITGRHRLGAAGEPETLSEVALKLARLFFLSHPPVHKLLHVEVEGSLIVALVIFHHRLPWLLIIKAWLRVPVALRLIHYVNWMRRCEGDLHPRKARRTSESSTGIE